MGFAASGVILQCFSDSSVIDHSFKLNADLDSQNHWLNAAVRKGLVRQSAKG